MASLVGVPLVRLQFLYYSSVVYLFLVVVNGGFRLAMMQGVGNVILMRGGACATELCLMVGWVCGVTTVGCGLPSCGLWECILRFRGVLGARCAFGVLSLDGIGGGFKTSVG